MSKSMKEELLEMGFKGALLHNLLQVIIDNDTLHTFYNFILESEGEKMTKVLLVHKFNEYMQDKKSYENCEEFVSALQTADTEEEKEKVVEKLFAQSASQSMLKKVVSVLEVSSTEDVLKMYQLIVKWRKMHNPNEIFTLLESLPI
ncbi:hypothetical protein M5X00_26295 [Paenibacillus alvei]|uniref:hypothetical protein n=1 Tax=Paenibacillus alvei TaxID=44250 RepID=UPI0002881041|nr:hypothetical protein [Paenibacillus alvei]EJW14088.1 hypothetical protein PAV_141p01940 [Paenibacillus alvei DSM 29]MCY9707762.1 hypothetical protein [Paenibacillus alvei]MCY9757743.1 hypothetical protein [Paenibacillus alvei]MEC0082725.1 hypothetical protein [Paenibacillus alvei]